MVIVKWIIIHSTLEIKEEDNNVEWVLRDIEGEAFYHHTVADEIKLVYYVPLFHNHFSWKQKFFMDFHCLYNKNNNFNVNLCLKSTYCNNFTMHVIII